MLKFKSQTNASGIHGPAVSICAAPAPFQRRPRKRFLKIFLMTEAVRVKILRIVTRMSHAQVVFFLLTQLNNFHSDPYVCEDWKETEFCSDKCDDNSTKLVTRACFPIQDPLPEEVEPPVLIKPGNRSCNSYSYCRGDNNLNSNQNGKVTVEPQTVDCPLSCPIGESLNILEYVDD